MATGVVEVSQSHGKELQGLDPLQPDVDHGPIVAGRGPLGTGVRNSNWHRTKHQFPRGHKTLVARNHDRGESGHAKGVSTWTGIYIENGFEQVIQGPPKPSSSAPARCSSIASLTAATPKTGLAMGIIAPSDRDSWLLPRS